MQLNKGISLDGEFDQIRESGINPHPVQQPIPIWFGAFVEPAIQRAGRIADGLLLNPRATPTDQGPEHIRMLRDAATAAGRDPLSLGIDATIYTHGRGKNAIRDDFEAWRELGATHITVRTMTAGYTSAKQHLEALEEARAAIG